MKKVLEKRKDVAFYLKLFPLQSHKDAKRKSESIMCSGSLALLEAAFDKKPVPDPTCKTDAVQKTIALANKLGITGTPAMIFPDGTHIPGSIPAERIIDLIEKKPL